MQDEADNLAEQEAPVKDETNNEQVAPTDESANSPEVPAEKEELILGKFKSQDDLVKSYQELEQKTTKTAQEKAQLEQYLREISSQEPQQTANTDIPGLDPEVVPALDKWYEDRRLREVQEEEIKKARALQERHADELKDPALSGIVLKLMSEARANQSYLDQEEALAQAKSLLDERVKSKVKEALTQGEATGAKIAQDRAKMGNVGETAPAQKINPDELSADEYAKYYNLPRA